MGWQEAPLSRFGVRLRTVLTPGIRLGAVRLGQAERVAVGAGWVPAARRQCRDFIRQHGLTGLDQALWESKHRPLGSVAETRDSEERLLVSAFSDDIHLEVQEIAPSGEIMNRHWWELPVGQARLLRKALDAAISETESGPGYVDGVLTNRWGHEDLPLPKRNEGGECDCFKPLLSEPGAVGAEALCGACSGTVIRRPCCCASPIVFSYELDGLDAGMAALCRACSGTMVVRGCTCANPHFRSRVVGAKTQCIHCGGIGFAYSCSCAKPNPLGAATATQATICARCRGVLA